MATRRTLHQRPLNSKILGHSLEVAPAAGTRACRLPTLNRYRVGGAAYWNVHLKN